MVRLPVIVIDYQPLVYSPHDEIEQARLDIHMWALWFPDYFIILSATEGDD